MMWQTWKLLQSYTTNEQPSKAKLKLVQYRHEYWYLNFLRYVIPFSSKHVLGRPLADVISNSTQVESGNADHG